MSLYERLHFKSYFGSEDSMSKVTGKTRGRDLTEVLMPY